MTHHRIFRTLRIAAAAALLALIVWMEHKQAYPQFRLISFGLGFLFLVCLASLFRGRSRDVLVGCASIAFGLSVLGAFAAWSEPKTVLNVSAGWSVFEPVLGWGAAAPGVYHAERLDPGSGAKIYSVDYTFDSNLARQTTSAETGAAIVFFGDSLTFGFGLNDADTLPQRFADLLQPKQRVLNLAIGGYSPQQFLRTLETGFRDSVIGPDPRLFVYMAAAWQSERSSCKVDWAVNAPRYALENGALKFKGPCYEGWRLMAQRVLWDTALYRYFVEPYWRAASRDDIELYIRELTAAISLAKEKYRVETLIPYVRSAPGTLNNTGFTEEDIMQRLRDSGAFVVDVSLKTEEAQGAEIYIPGDGHPTPLANRLRADLLKSYIAQHMSGILLSQLE